MRSARAALRTASALLLPGGVMLLSAVAALQIGPERASWQAFREVFPEVSATLGILLGLRFLQGRIVMGVAALALAGLGLSASAGDVRATALIATLLPINLTALALLPERGLFSERGLVRLALFAIQIGLVALGLGATGRGLLPALERPLADPAWFAWTQLPQLALLCYALGIVVLGARFVVWRSSLDAGFFWALSASAIGLDRASAPDIGAAYLATAELILAVAVVEKSFALAYRDELTGLPGRRALGEELSGLEPPYTLAMLDIDHFKQINDRHGHDVGDQVLRMVAARLGQILGGGRPYRYGGEEFALVFRRTQLRDAKPHLERLRREIAESRFVLREADRGARKPPARGPKPQGRRGRSSGAERAGELRLTVSIGAAEPGPDAALAEDVLKAADRALYKAKAAGRNCLKP